MQSIRKFFFLTARDLGMQTSTVEEIAEAMKPGPVDPTRLPIKFAEKLTTILELETSRSGDNKKT